jgi:hypothetical protein
MLACVNLMSYSQSGVLAVKRHNGFKIRDVSIESRANVASDGLYPVSQNYCAFL